MTRNWFVRVLITFAFLMLNTVFSAFLERWEVNLTVLVFPVAYFAFLFGGVYSDTADILRWEKEKKVLDKRRRERIAEVESDSLRESQP